jgi:hypothetical protein
MRSLGPCSRGTIADFSSMDASAVHGHDAGQGHKTQEKGAPVLAIRVDPAFGSWKLTPIAKERSAWLR